MRHSIILATLCLILGTVSAFAQSENIVLHYDFESAKGAVVKDLGPNHADAKLMNGAKIEDGKLVLKEKDAYLDMGEKAGAVIKGLKDFTVSVRYKLKDSAEIKGNGYFLWCFSTLAANKEKEGPYHAYRINQQRVETSIGGWSQETGIQVNKVSEKDKWVSVVFRQKDGKGELFINGKLIGTQTGFPQLSKIFTAAPKYNWIGRAPFAGDNYLTKVKIADFRVYNVAVSDKRIQKFADKAKEKNDNQKKKK